MREFYTIDRLGTLKEGEVFNLTRFSDLNPKELQTHVDLMFPDGVSRHGDEYFLKNSSRANVASPAIELLFEYVRRAYFKDCPSRFQSWFGVESVKDAVAFRNEFGGGVGSVWVISAKRFFRGNMRLLTSNQTTLVYSYFANIYWRGETGPISGFWEVLLQPPIHVIRKVPEEDLHT